MLSLRKMDRLTDTASPRCNQPARGDLMHQKLSDARVRRMFAGDRIWAFGSIGVLWIIYAFTYWQLSVSQDESGVLGALAIAGGLVLLFNTASIAAMMRSCARQTIPCMSGVS